MQCFISDKTPHTKATSTRVWIFWNRIHFVHESARSSYKKPVNLVTETELFWTSSPEAVYGPVHTNKGKKYAVSKMSGFVWTCLKRKRCIWCIIDHLIGQWAFGLSMSFWYDDQLILTLKRPFKAYKNLNSTFESPKMTISNVMKILANNGNKHNVQRTSVTSSLDSRSVFHTQA